MTYTLLNISNGTPEGLPKGAKDLRATLPINQLKGNPPLEDCPISNVHRRKNDKNKKNSDGICCYSCCFWYYRSLRDLFTKDEIVFIDNPLHSPLIEKCHICGLNVNPETIAKNTHIRPTILCDTCVKRVYFDTTVKVDDIRYAKL